MLACYIEAAEMCAAACCDGSRQEHFFHGASAKLVEAEESFA